MVDGHHRRSERPPRAIRDPAKPNTAELKKLANQLAALSDLLTQHYFSHSVRRVY